MPRARKLERISYDEMLELASLGAKVLQIRSVEFAKRYGVPVHVRSSFNESEGTWVVEEEASMEDVSVAGVTSRPRRGEDHAAAACRTSPGSRRGSSGRSPAAGIVVDMIIQNASADGTTDITFTVPRGDYDKALALVEAIAREIGAQRRARRLDVAKVSIVGVGMRTHAGRRGAHVRGARGRGHQHPDDLDLRDQDLGRDRRQVHRARRARAARRLHRLTDLMRRSVQLYDTTLRDGCQAEDVSFTLEDKLRIAERLDDLGIHYIEGGWPGSNPRDEEFFRAVAALDAARTRASRPSARRAGRASRRPTTATSQLLLRAETPVVTIVGKTWDLHVRDDLRIPLEENLDVIRDSVAYLQAARRRGRSSTPSTSSTASPRNPELRARVPARRPRRRAPTLLCLCDTRGGALPVAVGRGRRRRARRDPGAALGIHCHNDCELAVANSLAARRARLRPGAGHDQRLRRALRQRQPRVRHPDAPAEARLPLRRRRRSSQRLAEVSHFVYELANLEPSKRQPYVGQSAFAHKGGLHVAAVQKNAETYEHIDPALVGNVQRVLVSDLSGRSNLLAKAQQFGIDLAQRQAGGADAARRS